MKTAAGASEADQGVIVQMYMKTYLSLKKVIVVVLSVIFLMALERMQL